MKGFKEAYDEIISQMNTNGITENMMRRTYTGHVVKNGSVFQGKTTGGNDSQTLVCFLDGDKFLYIQKTKGKYSPVIGIANTFQNLAWVIGWDNVPVEDDCSYVQQDWVARKIGEYYAKNKKYPSCKIMYFDDLDSEKCIQDCDSRTDISQDLDDMYQIDLQHYQDSGKEYLLVAQFPQMKMKFGKCYMTDSHREEHVDALTSQFTEYDVQKVFERNQAKHWVGTCQYDQGFVYGQPNQRI